MTKYIKKEGKIYEVTENSVDKSNIEFHILQLQSQIADLESQLEEIELVELEIDKI